MCDFSPGACREFPLLKKDRAECERGRRDGFFMSFLNLFLKRFNNAKGDSNSETKVRKRFRRSGTPSLHPSLTLGSQKHMQELDVLLRRLLPQFSNLEPKANTEFKIRTYQMGRSFSSTQVITFCFVLLKGKRDKAELIIYSQEEIK